MRPVVVEACVILDYNINMRAFTTLRGWGIEKKRLLRRPQQVALCDLV